MVESTPAAQVYPASPPPFIRVSDVTVKYSGVTALESLDWEVRPGEVHCLVGENGCGKSTTIKVLAGVTQPEPGALIEIDGKHYERLAPQVSKQLGIQVVYQDLSLFPNLSVAENITFEDSLASRIGLVSMTQRLRGAEAALARLGVSLPLHALVGDLPIATRQLVAICRGMASAARLLFLDEPTASLTRAEVAGLFDVVARLKAAGVAVVFVSHRLDEIAQIAERVTVLRDGKKLGTFSSDSLSSKRMAELMTGKQIEHTVRARDRSAAPEVLRVQGLTRPGEYRGVNLQVRQGEIVGLLGRLGAGRTELALSLFGMSPPQSGEVTLLGRRMRARSNRDAIDAGIAYVSEDRLGIGLNMRQSVQDNMLLAVLRRISSRLGWLPAARRAKVAADWRDKLKIKIPSLDAPVSQLSGGNAQRVVLTKWLATEPTLLILDSPTVGVDIGNKQGIYEIVHSLADAGVAVLMISDEVQEVFFNCDRVLHMRGGEVVAEFIPGTHTEADIAQAVYA
ncbi:MAG: sugar ABC transporter ATP-binding protein [Rhizobacter sp.]